MTDRVTVLLGRPVALNDPMLPPVESTWSIHRCLCNNEVYLAPIDVATQEATGASIRCPACVHR
jgi:hypothetical protein